jgi:hypothetical protein
MSTARGGIYHTISICAIVVPLLRHNPCVFIANIRVLAALLYKGKNYNLQYTWVKDL